MARFTRKSELSRRQFIGMGLLGAETLAILDHAFAVQERTANAVMTTSRFDETRSVLIAFIILLISVAGSQAEASRARGRWSEKAANEWYAKQPWLVGANYIPSNAVNQLEMWQADTFDPKRIDLELSWAESLGMNTMRVFLHDLLWQQDSEGFKNRVGTFLQIAQRHHIKPLFVLFDSCWDPNPRLGKQHAPRPGVHNSGWVQSPGAAELRDASQYPKLEAYVKGVVGAFAKDDRVLGWDVWNEPTIVGFSGSNWPELEASHKDELVLALLPKVFEWARAADPSQPLTSGVWAGGWSSWDKWPRIAQIQIEESDILSFHGYDPPSMMEHKISVLLPYQRPILCTEYMARGNGSTFQNTLPLFKKHHIGAINWGLVAGKTQTYFPWDSWKKPYLNGEPTPWHHDIFRADGEAYDRRETESIRDMTRNLVPVIDVTDLYVPPSDYGDNFDLVTAYALPEIDLKAVILDVTQTQRDGGRDPGIIPVEQLNYLFNRNVPYAAGPFTPMKSLDDKMLDAPAFQQQGVELLLRTLRDSPIPVAILSFGSLRPIAVAYNREPDLFHAKVSTVYISAGTYHVSLPAASTVSHGTDSGPEFKLEWNVMLDALAFVRMLRSDLPIALYPCAGKGGSATELDPHSSFWSAPNLNFIHQMDAKVARYLSYSFLWGPYGKGETSGNDTRRLEFLGALDNGMSDAENAAADREFAQPHNVWETAVWMAVSGRSLVRHEDGSYEIIPAQLMKAADERLKNDLLPCHMFVRDDANFACAPTEGPSNFRIYDRGDSNVNQTALREALPALYRSFRVP